MAEGGWPEPVSVSPDSVWELLVICPFPSVGQQLVTGAREPWSLVKHPCQMGHGHLPACEPLRAGSEALPTEHNPESSPAPPKTPHSMKPSPSEQEGRAQGLQGEQERGLGSRGASQQCGL